MCTKVTFVCGNRTAIRDVSEPRTCEYVLELGTPLVCHPNSMLVYPTLSDELRDDWDSLEGLRQHNIITDKVCGIQIIIIIIIIKTIAINVT